MLIFKPVRDAAIALLRDVTNGFNARAEQLCREASIQPLAIDWDAGSTSFLQAAIARDSEDIDYSQVFPRPLSLCMYIAQAANTSDQMPAMFSGKLALSLDFYLRFRFREGTADTLEMDDAETPGDIVLEAAIAALNRDVSFGNLSYNKDYLVSKSPLTLYADGFMQRVSLDLAFEVTA